MFQTQQVRANWRHLLMLELHRGEVLNSQDWCEESWSYHYWEKMLLTQYFCNLRVCLWENLSHSTRLAGKIPAIRVRLSNDTQLLTQKTIQKGIKGGGNEGKQYELELTENPLKFIQLSLGENPSMTDPIVQKCIVKFWKLLLNFNAQDNNISMDFFFSGFGFRWTDLLVFRSMSSSSQCRFFSLEGFQWCHNFEFLCTVQLNSDGVSLANANMFN